MMTAEQYINIDNRCGRKIAAVIYAHETWRRSDIGCGVRANLSGANLSRANLSWANLSGADLSGADLSGADLSGANLDYAQWPLWCGSLDAKIDKKIAAQLFYHACRAAQSVDDEGVRNAIAGCAKLANQFHRTECDRIK